MEYIKEGDKILSNKNMFFVKLNFLDREQQYRDAIEKYLSAMNKSKVSDDFETFELSAKKLITCYEKISDTTNIGRICCSLADRYFDKRQYDNAILYYKKAIEAFEIRFTNDLISKAYEKLSNVYNVIGDVEEEIKSFEMTIKFNMSETSKKPLLKYELAKKYALNEDYQKAIDLILETSSECVDNQAMKFNITKNLFIAIILSLIVGTVEEASSVYDKSCDLDLSFDRKLEGKISREIIDAVRNFDVESFTDSIREYDRITKFDNFYITILTNLKNKIQDRGEDDLR